MVPGLLQHFGIVLRLTARNRLGLFYSYLFPIIFFVSFLVLYRFEKPLLVRHMGELLTVGVLGGACFGLPTSIVSERERGVWRRYRLTPASTGTLVAGTLLARYVAIFVAGLVQLLLAMAIGGWVPAHPLDLWVAFSLMCFALLGLGLVLASLADTVPAVQALGQCIFLPMLIVGGVAVRLENLPEWVLPVTVFFPGRYAVEAVQECVNGGGLGPVGFPLAALLLIGASGCLAGAKLFRWDGQKRFVSIRNKSWIGVALACWVVIGTAAIQRGELAPRQARVWRTAPVTPDGSLLAEGGKAKPPADAGVAMPSPGAASGAAAASSPSTGNVDTGTAAAEPWRALGMFNFAAMPIADMPPDDGNISPIAEDGAEPAEGSAFFLKKVVEALPNWGPGHVSDRVQRVRNYLYILGAADYAQSPVERFLPGAVLAHMLKEFQPDELAKLLCWVALHPDQGDINALQDPLLVDLGAANLDPDEVRTRTYYYGVKLTRWVIGW